MTEYSVAAGSPGHWTSPPGKVDWLFGTGAVRTERALVWTVVALFGACLWFGYAGISPGVDLRWWQHAVVAFVVVDVVGGVVANALGSAKRLFHGAEPADISPAGRMLRNDVVFAAAHIHPLVLWAVFDGGSQAWGPFWYGTAVAAVAVVCVVPLYLKRPAAFAATTVAVLAATIVRAPAALSWFPVVLMLKLVLAHAVPEHAYRPGTEA